MDTNSNLRLLIDHTLLRPDATSAQIATLCHEAIAEGLFAVCVNPYWVGFASTHLAGHPVKLCAVAGFPLGASCSSIKAAEAVRAVEQGAHEVDMVLNLGALREGNHREVERDVRAVVDALAGQALLKVILECALLSPEEIVSACKISEAAGANFVKTSTGFSKAGASVEAVRLMRQTVGQRLGVKASGGIRDRSTALAMVEAGASRLGTSASLAIVNALG